MKTIKDLIKNNPVLTYFVITFAISWGCVLLVMGMTGGIPSTNEQTDRLMPVAIVAMLAGPSVAGLFLTGLVDGRTGYRKLLSRLLKWRVSLRWYAVALLTGPLVFAASLALSLISPQFIPGIFAASDKVPLLIIGIIAGVVVGIFEELGWTGFAIPKLRLRYSILSTGLIVGVIWGAWHLLTNDVWASRTISGELSPDLFLILNGLGLLIGQLPAYRILMVLVYDRTGSLLVAMLMHASLTACTLILQPTATGMALLLYGLAFTVLMWGLVAAVAVANRGQLSRQPL
ncbi:MAG: CPBP family glutamic-type intramembrane protease [Candidatus Margulisbacteria bacterium]|nr:CPBP family glutamic-type intramembrane protease [Candidatus Margulisiibacteriota bacterium]